MGTTLTGTTPQDTYDSLIKVTDNGPIGTSLKTLTDGLGNDSALALSSRGLKVNQSATLIADAASMCHFSNNYLYLRGGSAGLSIGDDAFSNSITLVDAGEIRFETGSAERLRITSAGNVGIGTSAPNVQLEVSAADNSLGGIFRLNNNRTSLFDGDQNGSIQFSNNEASGGANGVRSAILSLVRDAAGKTDLAFTTASSNGSANEKLRILADGGITFNGDTAAANALDDYEEGTWTPSFVMGTSGTVTMGDVLGRYTKVGNLVTCTGYANAASVSSPVGELRIAGLPFTTGSGGDSSIDIYAYGFGNTTAVTAYQGFTVGTLNYAIVRGFSNGDQVQNIGANVVGSAGIIFTITYRV